MATRAQLTALLLLGLFAVGAIAEGASRTSSYLGGSGSGKDFEKAKKALLDDYAKAKNKTYKITSEKVGDNSYTVTYEFPDAATLADFQSWQYKQSEYLQKLDKFSQKPKSTAGRRLI